MKLQEISAYKTVNTILLQRNWLIGYRIAEEGFLGADRAEYGANVIAKLSKTLTSEYGKGFTKTNLYNFYSFYKEYLRFSTPEWKISTSSFMDELPYSVTDQ